MAIDESNGNGAESDISGINTLDASAAAIVQETRNYFNSKNNSPNDYGDGGNDWSGYKKDWFRFEKVLGQGGFGIACRIVEHQPGRPPRRLAVKRALGGREEADLRREIRILRRLRGAEHIVRYVASYNGSNNDDDDGNSAGSRKSLGGLVRSVTQLITGSGSSEAGAEDDSSSGDFLAGLTGPVLVMEYLEHHDLALLLKRVQDQNIILPNRILWAFFLCLVRGCVALAYPPDGDDKTANKLETIPKGRKPENLQHGDLHLRNIMISDISSEFREHTFTPALKLIDFGQATKTIVAFIIHGPRTFSNFNPANYNGIATGAKEIVPAPYGNGDSYPTLDPLLRDFLARCLAISPKDRPSLAEMLSTAEAGARRSAEEYAPNEHLESDRAVRKAVRELIFNADSKKNPKNKTGDGVLTAGLVV
ncbi:kinase-like domain-containing protein [Biscogniauxia marginata]|nr:kinase-like domain-containing protein [Biscogniauxia marginata]